MQVLSPASSPLRILQLLSVCDPPGATLRSAQALAALLSCGHTGIGVRARPSGGRPAGPPRALTLLSPSGARGSVIQDPNLEPDVLMVTGSLIPVSLPQAAREQAQVRPALAAVGAGSPCSWPGISERLMLWLYLQTLGLPRTKSS